MTCASKPGARLGPGMGAGCEVVEEIGPEMAQKKSAHSFLLEFPVFSQVLSVAEMVNVVGPEMACAQAASGQRTGRSHQNGETVTRVVITKLVRPGNAGRAADFASFPPFSPPRTLPRPTPVGSWPGTSMPDPSGGFPFVRLARFSSSNPNLLSGR